MKKINYKESQSLSIKLWKEWKCKIQVSFCISKVERIWMRASRKSCARRLQEARHAFPKFTRVVNLVTMKITADSMQYNTITHVTTYTLWKWPSLGTWAVWPGSPGNYTRTTLQQNKQNKRQLAVSWRTGVVKWKVFVFSLFSKTVSVETAPTHTWVAYSIQG